MAKLVLLFCVVIVAFVAETTCQRYILPTYRPPRKTNRPIIRTVREADASQLWEGELSVPASIADESKQIPNKRVYRSVDSPSARRNGGHSSPGSRGDTGPTHPGYNRRNARAALMPDYHIDPHRPSVPSPYNPFIPRPGHPRGPYPIYARTVRDVNIPGLKKPSHRDIIIPNWNPNVRTQPWQRIDPARRG